VRIIQEPFVELHIVIQGRKDLANQVYDQLRESIESGRLAAGVQLPPSRLLAIQLGLSRKTISDTYSRLTYENYLVGKIGSGTFVNTLSSPARRSLVSSDLASVERVRKWQGISLPLRHPTLEGTLRCDFIGGATAKTQFPHDEWRRCTQYALRQMSPATLPLPAGSNAWPTTWWCATARSRRWT
jgi:GntR family transcriptional regulator/MocR family aminotransferase